uniref:Uncharacterized protein n=1 Tax=Coccidioides posadasii RMSCC 3488 TaxID=454284 RepID=A0A0J6FJC0_COCPO|nr:hypothetical protein CPAG_05267 [Coccidioides posadasii RMSCC 3488]
MNRRSPAGRFPISEKFCFLLFWPRWLSDGLADISETKKSSVRLLVCDGTKGFMRTGKGKRESRAWTGIDLISLPAPFPGVNLRVDNNSRQSGHPRIFADCDLGRRSQFT